MMTSPRQWSRCWLLAWLFVFSTAAAMLAQNPVPPDLSNSPSPHPTPLPPATVVSVAAKPFASLSGPAGGAFFITRTGNTSDSLPISYTLKGSAMNGFDYPKLPGIVAIPAGDATVVILIEPIARPDVKTGRSVVLQLQPESAYKIGTPASAEMTIRYQNIPVNRRPIVSLAANWVRPIGIKMDASVSDADGWVKRVEFFEGINRVGQAVQEEPVSGNSTLSFTWADARPGNYYLTAKATDNLGLSTTSTVARVTVPSISTIAIISPTNLTSFIQPADIHINATAIDPDGFIYQVNFYDANTKIGTSTLATLVAPPHGTPAHHSLEWKNAAPGLHTLYAEAKFASGITMRSEPVRVTVVKNPLTVKITSPTNDAAFTVPTNITLVAQATSSNAPAQKVEFFAGAKSLGVVTNNPVSSAVLPYQFTWTNPPYDQYTLTAIATDSRGATATSAPVRIMVTSRTNFLAITRPTNNAKAAAHANLDIQAAAIDPTSYISLVEFYDGDTKIGQSSLTFIVAPKPGTPLHHSFTWTNVPAGAHTLIARAKDHTGAKIVSAPVHITAYLAESQLTINSPTNGASFTAPAKIAIEATAIDPNGYMNLVEFYAGQTRIGESILLFGGLGGFPDPGTPLHHTFVWSNVQMGVYTLTAKSVNKAGKTVTSAPVEIRVLSPVSASFVERQLPDVYQPGIPLTVRLKVTPMKNTTVYTVEDQPPAGLAVGEMNAGGAYDIANHTVKFGPFFDLESRTLTYEVKPPATATGKKEFIGSASRDGVVYPISGQSLINQGKALYHPADNAPTDFVMTANEFTAYADAWKRGKAWPIGHNPIPASYVTQAGVLWKGGEKYVYMPTAGLPPLCWVNLKLWDDIKPLSTTGNAVVAAMLIKLNAAVCEMPATYSPNASFVVTIRVKPAPGTLVYTLEDRPPAGWTIGQIGPDGMFDPVASEVKWGPFLDGNERVLSYSVTPPKTASGTAIFTGLASFDGTDVPIMGQRQTAIEPGN